MNNQKKQPKKGSFWAILVFLIAMAVANAGDIDGELLVFILPVIIIIAALA